MPAITGMIQIMVVSGVVFRIGCAANGKRLPTPCSGGKQREGVMTELETRTIGKVMWRLMPVLFVCYFVAYLDRVNVGFAKLQMDSALGLSAASSGLGAGLFFSAYLLLGLARDFGSRGSCSPGG